MYTRQLNSPINPRPEGAVVCLVARSAAHLRVHALGWFTVVAAHLALRRHVTWLASILVHAVSGNHELFGASCLPHVCGSGSSDMLYLKCMHTSKQCPHDAFCFVCLCTDGSTFVTHARLQERGIHIHTHTHTVSFFAAVSRRLRASGSCHVERAGLPSTRALFQ